MSKSLQKTKFRNYLKQYLCMYLKIFLDIKKVPKQNKKLQYFLESPDLRFLDLRICTVNPSVFG